MAYFTTEYSATRLQMHHLQAAENLIVVSFRLWALARAENQRTHVPDWRLGFRAARLDDGAVTLFDQALQLICAHGRRPLEVQHLGCGGISPDERLFLQVVSLYQNQRPTRAESLLHQWLAPGAARAVSSLVMCIACTLESAGFFLPARETHRPLANRKPMAPGRGAHAATVH